MSTNVFNNHATYVLSTVLACVCVCVCVCACVLNYCSLTLFQLVSTIHTLLIGSTG